MARPAPTPPNGFDPARVLALLVDEFFLQISA